MNVKINTERKLRYVAVNFATGLSDLTLSVRKPDGSTLSPDPTFTEIDSEGIYEASYTPDALGIWQEKITSATNDDKLINTIVCVEKDIDTISDEVDAAKTALSGEHTTMEGNLSGEHATIEGKIDTVDGKIDALDAQIKPGGYIA